MSYMNVVGQKLNEDLKTMPFPDKMTAQQLWFIVKFAKAARRFCRSNVAFNNLSNQVFGDIAEFRQVTKTKADGSTYPGLRIVMKNGTTYDSEEGESDE